MQRERNNEARTSPVITVVAFCATSSLSLLAFVDRGIFYCVNQIFFGPEICAEIWIEIWAEIYPHIATENLGITLYKGCSKRNVLRERML